MSLEFTNPFMAQPAKKQERTKRGLSLETWQEIDATGRDLTAEEQAIQHDWEVNTTVTIAGLFAALEPIADELKAVRRRVAELEATPKIDPAAALKQAAMGFLEIEEDDANDVS